MLERYVFGFLILFLFSVKLIKALIKVSDTKSSACSKLFVFLQNYSAMEMQFVNFFIKIKNFFVALKIFKRAVNFAFVSVVVF